MHGNADLNRNLERNVLLTRSTLKLMQYIETTQLHAAISEPAICINMQHSLNRLHARPVEDQCVEYVAIVVMSTDHLYFDVVCCFYGFTSLI